MADLSADGRAATDGVRPAVRPDLVALTGYHSPQVDVEVRLNTNESPLAPPDAWLEEFRRELADVDFNRYPDRQATALRQALADSHGVDPAQIFCANGSNEVLQSLMLAYGGPGRTVALFEPTYTMHGQIARTTGTTVAAGQRTDDFLLDLGEVDRVLDASRPVITFLCSPNNPTGRADPPEVIEAVVDRAPGLVVVDEAYGQFAPSSALDIVRGTSLRAARTVVVRTFSKTWSMAAARLGYLVGPAEVVEACELVALPYHLDAVKQLAGRLALDYKSEMEARVAMLTEERGRIAATLAELPVETWPSDANFILFRPTHRAAREVWSGLLDRSVLVRDCSEWPGVTGCLRVTVGLPAENDRFLKALNESLQ
ncbi:MAG TPA: histidinol-phosphate transaminase [Acidimicrobiales bacterium]|nr:histidinol-phosphate transaminase [Acidimicrobiales bacterium]